MTIPAMKTPITDMVRGQQGDYLAAVEELERGHAALLRAAKELITTLELVITNPITAFEIRIAKEAVFQGRATIEAAEGR